MIETALPVTPPASLERPHTEVVTYHLDPLQVLPVGDRDHTLYVSEGVVHVVLQDEELALTAGDQIGVRAGELKRAWNAGRAIARVAVGTRRPRLI